MTSPGIVYAPGEQMTTGNPRQQPHVEVWERSDGVPILIDTATQDLKVLKRLRYKQHDEMFGQFPAIQRDRVQQAPPIEDILSLFLNDADPERAALARRLYIKLTEPSSPVVELNVCDRCNQEFRTAPMLVAHQWSCTGIPEAAAGESPPSEASEPPVLDNAPVATKTYTCDQCPETFVSPQQKGTHVYRVHGKGRKK